MKIRLRDTLPYVTASLTYQGQQLSFRNVLLDTGSAGVIFSTERVLTIGLTYEPDDSVHRIRGVGGTEFVFTKRLDCLAVGELQINDFQIEVGAMDYGFDIDGIIGMDFLIQVGAIIDLAILEMYPASK
ncbi:retropepsin-like domain-containing protein [Dehalococcoidia bacterium]|nr:retropepsin-like domain-containing protein [Dehalococcoidia bacterium]MCL0073967.1 retropepsin-like domain-containing protein [Dehalococcoidia bacterium]